MYWSCRKPSTIFSSSVAHNCFSPLQNLFAGIRNSAKSGDLLEHPGRQQSLAIACLKQLETKLTYSNKICNKSTWLFISGTVVAYDLYPRGKNCCSRDFSFFSFFQIDLTCTTHTVRPLRLIVPMKIQ